MQRHDAQHPLQLMLVAPSSWLNIMYHTGTRVKFDSVGAVALDAESIRKTYPRTLGWYLYRTDISV